ncbi:MAG: Gfo/Idh/MocA family oxidoreductase [Bifidobacteriaceae bacterium]|jgi:predicted dehydrogenase|nr:Gfo/Idh/MocA family oxidoreductase [Bifidobacteriaceae bacterium]
METILDPFDAPPLNWGFMGPGGIAATVAESLVKATRQRLVAVGSRSLERAEAFARRFGAPRAYGSYAALAADPEVDAVYIATLHHTHFPLAVLALEAGKAVLVEKAFTLNQAEARQLADLAGRRGLFLMEAMWTRFLPHMIELRNWAAAGRLGEIRYLQADFGFAHDYDPTSRMFDPAVGGGALLDRGVYPLYLAADFLGLPSRVAASATLAPSGADAQFSAILDYPRGQALIESSMIVTTPQEAWLAGTEAMVRIPARYWSPTGLELHADGKVETWRRQVVGAGYEFELAEVARRVSDGATGSAVMPVAESVELTGLLDQIRGQIGVVWPGEAG